MKTLVMKFGGSALNSTSTALTTLVEVVLESRQKWDQVVLVISALDAVTDWLLDGAEQARTDSARGRHRQVIANIRTRHFTLVEELGLKPEEEVALQAEIDRLLFDTSDLYQSIARATQKDLPALRDAAIGVGERLSVRLISALLRKHGIQAVPLDADSFLVTNDNYGHAEPDETASAERMAIHLVPLLKRGLTPVVTGFIGATVKGKATTLGRGGSDLTAATIASCIQADEVWFWSDVDGIMSADPKIIADAHAIPALTYSELKDMARCGAYIIHRDSITPLERKAIPLRVKNIYRRNTLGTEITTRSPEAGIKSVTTISGLRFRHPTSAPLSPLLSLIENHMPSLIHTRFDIVEAYSNLSQSSLTVLIPVSAGKNAPLRVRNALQLLLDPQAHLSGWTIEPITIVTVVGIQRQSQGEVYAAISHFAPMPAIAQAPSPASLSFIVPELQGKALLETLHTLLV